MRKTVVPDYNAWVKPEDEMWLEKIRGRISKYHYATAAAFVADLDQIRVNAEAYNTPGHGRVGAATVPAIAVNMVKYAQVGVDVVWGHGRAGRQGCGGGVWWGWGWG